jgi:hypothetical protein
LAGDGQQKGAATVNNRINNCTMMLDADKSGQQQRSRQGAIMPNQTAAPVLQQVGLMPVSSCSREEGVENVAPRDIDFQMDDGRD